MLAEKAGKPLAHQADRDGRGPRRFRRGRVGLTAALVAAAVAAWLAVATSGGSGSGGVPVATSSLPHVSDFVLPSVHAGASNVALASASGRPVVLSFFASWCTGCQQELKTMQQVVRSAPTGVEIIGVDVNDSDSAVRALLASDHLTYPVGADSNGNVASAFGLVGLPTTLFLDAGHHAVGQVVGPLTPSAARPWLKKIGGA